jgi:hypothetical protein
LLIEAMVTTVRTVDYNDAGRIESIDLLLTPRRKQLRQQAPTRMT